MIGRKVRVAQGHVAGAVTQKITHCVQRNAVLDQARSKVMTQIVPAEFADPGALESLFPRRPKSGGDIEDTRSSSGLFAPVPQHVQGFLIEGYMSGLAILRAPALDGEEPTAEVHGTPTQLENLAAPQRCWTHLSCPRLLSDALQLKCRRLGVKSSRNQRTATFWLTRWPLRTIGR